MGSLHPERIKQTLLIVSFLGCCWLGMQAVHEFGHVAAAWAWGAEVIRVRLHPLIISQTLLGANPRPGMVVWAGPLVGALLPLSAFGIAKLFHWPGVYLVRFFAGFCLAANGIYLVMGPAEGEADTAVMIANGAPRWIVIVVGTSLLATGVSLWHREGQHFGLGASRGKVAPGAMYFSILLLMMILATELWFDSR